NASLRQPQGSKQIECLINSDGQEVIIEIADQGCGIDEALRDRIFERGVTSSASKDHAIGLWLVRSYVEQAGGSIVVENNIPFGNIFTLYIPLTRDEHH
ncbi:ATP-binding protein, partial [Klebsiella pneumoniae]|uniref:ATP-binding protein n=1 Tax=Klebsiella pneumoniae TaxID=573 RepID=UPI002731A394